MHEDPTENILAEFDLQRGLYCDFTKRCESLLRELLDAAGYRVHSVTSRVKERDHLLEKITREGKEYERLSDVKDVSGVRVITYFDDQVDDIGSVIEKEFLVDPHHSVDKRKLLDPDRFGYLSLHYVCDLNRTRLSLLENKRYAAQSCEIQVRSILQHAWAEIEHDLGYKSDSKIPGPIRRRFSRLAGLLELGDQEFKDIRKELLAYQSRVPQEMQVAPGEVEVDDVSLNVFISTNELCIYLDGELANAANVEKTRPRTNEGIVKLATQLQYVGISSISQLQDKLERYKYMIVEQFAKRLEVRKHNFGGSVARGICLYQLGQLLAIARGLEFLVQYFEQFHISISNGTPRSTAQEIYAVVEPLLRAKDV